MKVLPYKKPCHRPEPLIQPPPKLDELKLTKCDDIKKSQLTELVHHLGRNICETGNHLPPWDAFHVLLHQESTPASAISYNPILMAPPTDYKSIFTTLMKNKEIVDDLGHKHLPIFFDMGLLTKALKITWAKPEELAGVYPCEGGMHLFMAVTAAIGHLYGSTGLSNLLYDSDVFAAGTAQQILSGRDFDRGLYAMKLLNEVFNSLLLDEFGHWCRDRDIAVPPELNRGLQELQQEYNCTSPDSVCAAKLVYKLNKQ